MSICILDENGKVKVDFIVFSDGAEICELPSLPSGEVVIVLDVENCSVDIVRLMLVKDVLDNLGFTGVSLTLPYIPNARADRRFKYNQSHSLKVFCNIINSLLFKRVTVYDPHSDVSTALLNNVTVNDQVNCFINKKSQIDKVSSNYILCSPDLGATKKTFDLSMKTGMDLIQAVKIRDTSTGNIIKCDVQCDDLGSRDVVIVDDIADGGASFIYLARKLKAKGAGNIILFVTHGIFSKGLAPLVDDIDYIFVDNLIEKFVNIRDIQLFNDKGE